MSTEKVVVLCDLGPQTRKAAHTSFWEYNPLLCWYAVMHYTSIWLLDLVSRPFSIANGKKDSLLPLKSLSLACSGKMDEDSLGFIRAPLLLFIAWLCTARSALLCPCKDAGACGVDETFLCPGGYSLWRTAACLGGWGCGGQSKATMHEVKPVKFPIQCMAAALLCLRPKPAACQWSCAVPVSFASGCLIMPLGEEVNVEILR